MRTTFLCVASALVAVLSVVAWRSAGGAEGPGKGLPGARRTIEAADYPSLQAALDALPAEGGVVRLPAGTFEITEPLVLQTGEVLLEGAGPATHVKNTNTKGQPALIIRPKAHATDRKAYLWRVQLSKFRLTGNDQGGHGIEALRVNELFLDGVTVSHHGGDGIRLDHCYEDPRICHSMITYNKQTGLALIGCHDIVVAANQFEENRDAVQCLDSFNLCMTGNNVDDHLRHGVVIENTYGSVISGNMIEECRGTAIVLDRDCYGITLSANVLAHNFGGGIDLRDAHGCTVTGNSLPLCGQESQFGLKISPESSRLTVVGNHFGDSYLGRGVTKRTGPGNAAAGLVLDGASDVNLTGNSFSGLSTKALEQKGQPGRRVLFGNNVLTGVDSDHDKLTESHVTDNLKRQ
jgi:hypothetical protein